MSSDSLDKDFCLQKLDSTISLIERLRDGYHPHRDSLQALEQILRVYAGDKTLLNSLDNTTQKDTTLEYCRRININLVRFKTFLGLLLRSTNIRNAFEIYFPIRILASELVGSNAKIILGSEWNFSPYTYPVALPELPDFIFIGIPASECQNPLILPLAGHELGHVVWRRTTAKTEFDPIIRATILELYKTNWTDFARLFGITQSKDKLESDLFLSRIWGKSFKIAQRQLEEVFCDFMGIYIFGTSFLHSFRYLLAPSLGQFRSPLYPRIADRAQYMLFFAKKYGVADRPGFSDTFSESDPALSPNDAFILEIADRATKQLYDQLPDFVNKYHGTVECFNTGTATEPAVKDCLMSLVPPVLTKSIAAIVNAAWTIRLDLDGWKILEDEKNDEKRRAEKLRILRDLVLKSFEVYEFMKRLEKYAAKHP